MKLKNNPPLPPEKTNRKENDTETETITNDSEITLSKVQSLPPFLQTDIQTNRQTNRPGTVGSPKHRHWNKKKSETKTSMNQTKLI